MDESTWHNGLRHVLSDAGSRPALLLVEGAAGSGKTTCAVKLFRTAASLGARCVRVSFSSSGALLLRDRTGPGDLATAPGPAGTPAVDLSSLWEQPAPALLVIEDVQRAPRHARDALAGWVEQGRRGYATVVTYRPEELPYQQLPLGPGVAYPPDLSVRRLRPAPWGVPETRALVHTVLGAERCTQSLVTHLQRRSGGNPQVIADLLELLQEAAAPPAVPSPHDVDLLDVPVRLADLTASRLTGLDAAARLVVEVAAVVNCLAGTAEVPFAPQELLTVTGSAGAAGDTGERALAEAVRTALLRESEQPGTYGFAVPLAAAAVYETMPGPLRRRLHDQVAGVLVRRQPIPWVLVAEHRRRAGDYRGWLRAMERAAGDPSAFADHELATAMLRPVLGTPEIPQDVRGRLALRLARNAVLTLSSPRTVEVLRQIVASQNLAREVRGEIRLEMGLLIHNQLAEPEGRRELELAVPELRDSPELLVRAMTALSSPFAAGAALDDHLAWLNRADSVARERCGSAARAAVLAARATIAVACGDRTARTHLRRLPAPGPQLGPRENEYIARGLNNAACSAVFAGHYRHAAELLDRNRQGAAAAHAPFLAHCDRGTALLLDFEQGRWDGLGPRCREVLSEIGMRTDATLVLILLALAKGRWADMADLWPEGTRRPGPFGLLAYEAMATGALIRWARARGQDEEAVTTSDEIWQRLKDKRIWVWAAHVAPSAVQTWLAAGQAARAADAVAEFAAGLRGHNSPVAAGALLWCRASLAEHSGSPHTAHTLFTRASAVFARLPRPYSQALTLEGAGRCGLADGSDAGEVADAAAQLATAVRLFEDLGASWDCARARSELRGHEPAAPPDDPAAPTARPRGRPGYGDTLSPREREVAELAAGGMTNREIAETLHLSPRTVEHHIARAMQKSGTQSRRGVIPGIRG